MRAPFETGATDPEVGSTLFLSLFRFGALFKSTALLCFGGSVIGGGASIKVLLISLAGLSYK